MEKEDPNEVQICEFKGQNFDNLNNTGNNPSECI
jgi:hypothetical protein